MNKVERSSFLSFRRYLYLKIALGGIVLATLALALDPAPVSNGGSWLGYTLGGLAAALALWLTGLGLRKRAYRSRLGTVQGWVSAHVYLGLALVLLIPLHSGFQFGWNIHTLSLVLLLAVAATGLRGVYAYIRFPPLLARIRDGVAIDALHRAQQELRAECLAAAEALPAPLRADIQRLLAPGVSSHTRRTKLRFGTSSLRTLTETADQPDASEWAEALHRVQELLAYHQAAREQAESAARAAQQMHAWLAWHVVLSAGFIASVLVHVITVFLYW